MGRHKNASPKTTYDSNMAACPSCGGKNTFPITSLKYPNTAKSYLEVQKKRMIRISVTDREKVQYTNNTSKTLHTIPKCFQLLLRLSAWFYSSFWFAPLEFHQTNQEQITRRRHHRNFYSPLGVRPNYKLGILAHPGTSLSLFFFLKEYWI